MPTEMLGSTDRRAFNPARDIARVIMPMSAKAIETLTTADGPAGYIRDSFKILDEDLADLAMAYKTLMERLLDSSQAPLTLGQAMELSGFNKTGAGAQAVLFTRLGQLCFSAAYSGVHDIQAIEDSICTDQTLFERAMSGLNENTNLADKVYAYESLLNAARSDLAHAKQKLETTEKEVYNLRTEVGQLRLQLAKKGRTLRQRLKAWLLETK